MIELIVKNMFSWLSLLLVRSTFNIYDNKFFDKKEGREKKVLNKAV